MKLIVRHKETGLVMMADRYFNPVKQRQVATFWWVHSPENASVYLSDEDAFLALERSGCGDRKGNDYEVVPV